MRNLLLTLLLANVLYFLWEQFVATPDEQGIAIVRESQLGPELQLADPATAESAGGEDSAEPQTQPTQLAASTGPSCVSIGPFRESPEADGALAEFEDEGLRGNVRTTEGEVFVGHWVQIRDIPSRGEANRMLSTLKQGGLTEAYIVQTEEEGIKISLGLFNDLSGAERIELQAESMDIPADISPRMREATVFYVDLGLPPGRGAGSMIERFGEDRVALRDQATCPRSN